MNKGHMSFSHEFLPICSLYWLFFFFLKLRIGLRFSLPLNKMVWTLHLYQATPWRGTTEDQSIVTPVASLFWIFKTQRLSFSLNDLLILCPFIKYFWSAYQMPVWDKKRASVWGAGDYSVASGLLGVDGFVQLIPQACACFALFWVNLFIEFPQSRGMLLSIGAHSTFGQLLTICSLFSFLLYNK